MIGDVAGKDCTKEFDDFGHSSDAKQILKKFKIGELVEVKNLFFNTLHVASSKLGNENNKYVEIDICRRTNVRIARRIRRKPKT